MRQYEMYEMSFLGEPPKENDVEAELYGTFTTAGKSTTVKGFYDGGGQYKIRFYPIQAGIYEYRVSGVIQTCGSLECAPACGKKHGRVVAQGCHFSYEDGSRYIPFGTTIYAMVHQEEILIAQTIESLQHAPFNKVRLCVFPKDTPYSRNEPVRYPFFRDAQGRWDVRHPDFDFWNHLEKQIFALGELGIETDLILFHPYDRWGFAQLSMEDNLVYLEYLLRRLAAVPHLWWSMANEYDLVSVKTPENWHEIERYIAENDPFGHLLSNHNCVQYYDFTRKYITHCSMQTMAVHMADAWMKTWQKPVVIDECCYEGNIEFDWGNLSGFEMVNRFWQAYAKGAFASHGETFYAEDEVLWWAKGGKLKGESVERIAFLKDLMYELPGALEPWNESDFASNNQLVPGNILDRIAELMEGISETDRNNLAWKSPSYTGHCGTEAFLKYFARQCAAIAYLELPAEYRYRVEVIDVWMMTREVIAEGVSGHIKLCLPGREGIAVLARRNE